MLWPRATWNGRLTLVRRLLDQGESAIGILLVAILPTVRNLLLAKDLMERNRMNRPHQPFQFISALNRLPESATQHLPEKERWCHQRLRARASPRRTLTASTPRVLIEGMEACLQANVRLISTQLEHELVLTEVVVKVLGVDNRPRG